jgi:hypothetical protein
LRHITGFILALAMSAALFFGGGWGIWRIASAHGAGSPLGDGQALTSVPGLLAVGAVVGTGLLLGILLAVPAVSPLAAGLPGLGLLGWSGLVVAHSRYALRFVPLPGSHYAAGFTSMLFSGALALAGTAMVVPLLVPSRWRRSYVDDEFDDDDIDVSAELGLVPHESEPRRWAETR